MQSIPNMGVQNNAARKTAYAANQHSVSIMGSDAGRIHIPSNMNMQESFKFGDKPKQ